MPVLPDPVLVPVPVRLPLVSPGMARPVPVVLPGVVLPGEVVLGEFPMPGPGMLLPEAAEPVPPTDCASARPGAMNPERMRANIVFFMIFVPFEGRFAQSSGPTLQAPYHSGVAIGDKGSGDAASYAQ